MSTKEQDPQSAEIVVLPDGRISVPLPEGKRVIIGGNGGKASHSLSRVVERLAILAKRKYTGLTVFLLLAKKYLII